MTNEELYEAGMGPIGHLSAELASRAGAWDGDAPAWFPEPPEWAELWQEAINQTRENRA